MSPSAFARQLDSWQLLPQTETFTQLFFTDKSQSGETSSQYVAFAIHNNEHQSVNYAYRITAHPPSGESQELAADTASLAHGATQYINKDVALSATGRTLIKVELDFALADSAHRHKQSIHYWVNVLPSVQQEVSDE